MRWQDQLRYKYNMAGVLEKLIAVNVLVFILQFFLQTIGFLFKIEVNFIFDWFSFPTHLKALLFKPWSIITYAFLHGGLLHLFFNMIILYFSGRLFLTFFSPKRLLNYYFLGAISGAMLFALSYNLFPAFSALGNVPLVGASAAVTAILVGVATQAPHMQIRMMFIGNIKLWWIAAFLVVFDFIQIPFGNAGGHIAHLGGALLGYAYTTQLSKGNDIGAWFEKIINTIEAWFEPTKKKPFKNVYKNTAKTKSKKTAAGFTHPVEKQKKIDAILDKISKNGYESLTKAEKDYLFKAGKE
ncbi:rhomboid family intramembrane serine protease [Mesonia ostreae]|uniref:Rhomboid family intramembrane serine protease n=1 Tax=Mesonia ostreae TaxID=861110 RepID=A0ABU2KLL5_9FLAO|nr:rhomboid family intramembrane serine protease [Mesonia ostreae]MDT0295616.1 rhomboid family intramembrane serine protease [Mesonia ostreae]